MKVQRGLAQIQKTPDADAISKDAAQQKLTDAAPNGAAEDATKTPASAEVVKSSRAAAAAGDAAARQRLGLDDTALKQQALKTAADKALAAGMINEHDHRAMTDGKVSTADVTQLRNVVRDSADDPAKQAIALELQGAINAVKAGQGFVTNAVEALKDGGRNQREIIKSIDR